MLLSLLSVCLAANNRIYDERNAQIVYGLDERPFGTVASGTKVEVGFSCAVYDVNPTSLPRWESARVLSIRIRNSQASPSLDHSWGPFGLVDPPVGDGELSASDQAQSLLPVMATGTAAFRFSSTHFPHGSFIVFQMDVKVELKRGVGTGYEETRTIDLPTLDVTLTSHNIGHSYATAVNAGGTVLAETDPRYPKSAADNAWRAIQYIHPLLGPLAQGLRHDVVPSLARARDWIKAEITSSLGASTVFAVDTHGTVANFQDSLGTAIWPAMVGNAVDARGASFPHHHLVALFACSTLENGSRQLPVAFRSVNPDGSTIPNRAYIGYDSLMVSMLKENSLEDFVPWNECTTYHAEHSKLIFAKLLEGNTVKDAVDVANTRFLPRGNSGTAGLKFKLPTVVVGDPLTRLFFVYLTAEERAKLNQEKIDTWYYIY